MSHHVTIHHHSNRWRNSPTYLSFAPPLLQLLLLLVDSALSLDKSCQIIQISDFAWLHPLLLGKKMHENLEKKQLSVHILLPSLEDFEHSYRIQVERSECWIFSWPTPEFNPRIRESNSSKDIMT